MYFLSCLWEEWVDYVYAHKFDPLFFALMFYMCFATFAIMYMLANFYGSIILIMIGLVWCIFSAVFLIKTLANIRDRNFQYD